jgi:hypothetical protein
MGNHIATRGPAKLRKNRKSLRQVLFETLECRSMLSVSSTSPPVGSTYQLPGPFTLDLNFSTTINPSTVTASDLMLTGIPGASVTGVSMLPGNTTARFTISGVTQDGTLTASIASGAIVSSGGSSQPAFSGSYKVASFLPRAPFGSLIYDWAFADSIGSAGALKRTTIKLDPNQTLSIVATPNGATLQPKITVFDSANNIVATSTAASAGSIALLQTAHTQLAAPEDYTVQIEGIGGSTGSYSLQLTLNAAIEEEGKIAGAANNDLATAQNVTGSSFTAAGVSRLAVGGALSSASDQDYYRVSLNAGEATTFFGIGDGAAPISIELRNASGTPLATSLNVANSNVLPNFVAAESGDYFIRVVGTGSASYSVVVAKNAIFELEANDTSATAQNITGATKVFGNISNGTIQTINAFDSGFWNENSTHNPADKSYITGFSAGTQRKSYFIFNLGGSSVSTGQFVLSNPVGGYVSPDASETLSLSSAGVSVADVTASSGTFTYFYLGFGTSLGSATVSAANNGQDIIVPLGVFGPSEINSKRGQQFVVGASLSSISGTSDQYVFGNSGATSKKQLQLTLADTADWYSFDVSDISSLISLQTSTPGDAAGLFTNLLNPHIELYNPAGTLVASGSALADGRNESLQFQPLVAGTYKVRVVGESGTNGDYALSLSSGAPTQPFAVSNADIADNGHLRVAPTSVTIDFNNPILLTSLSIDDLKIDGATPSSMTLVDGNTVKFTFPTPLVDGTHTLAIAAGALLDVQGTPLSAFSRVFAVDNVAPRIVATSVQPGSLLDGGLLELQITFNEPMITTGLNNQDDMLLHANVSGTDYRFVSRSFDPSGTVLTVKYRSSSSAEHNILPEDYYTLTLTAGTTGGTNFMDLAGNALDGEFNGTFPTGNGTAGGDFVVSYGVDVEPHQFPTPLTPRHPLGGLIYDGEVSKTIDIAGDEDGFSLPVEAGQKVSVVVTPANADLQPTIELIDAIGTVLGSASAIGPGKSAILQSIPIVGTGVGNYRIIMRGAGGSTGIYSLHVTLNAAVETEDDRNGATNNTLATAQDIDSSQISLGTNSTRLAVTGTTNLGASGVLNDFELGTLPASFTRYGTATLTTPGGSGNSSKFAIKLAPFTDNSGFPPSLNELIQTVDLSNFSNVRLTFSHIKFTDDPEILPNTFVGHFNGDGVSISADGNTWYTIFNASTDDTIWTTDSIDLSAFAAATGISLGPNFKIKFQEYGNRSGRAYDNISITSPDPDFYRFTAKAGDRITIAAGGETSGGMQLELRSADNSLIASGTPNSTSPTKTITNFVVPATGVYYVAVAGNTGIDYGLTVTVNAIFDTESNDSFSSAQNVSSTRRVIGSTRPDQRTITVGYFDFAGGSPGNIPVVIQRAGLTPLQISDISTFDFNRVDILLVNIHSASAAPSALQARLGQIQSWVQSGGVLIAQDYLVSLNSNPITGPDPLLLGAPNTLTVSNTQTGNLDDIDVIPPGNNLLVNGPFGVITDETLDESYATSGWIDGATLPPGAIELLDYGGNPDRPVAISYPLGSGAVYFAKNGFETSVYAPNLMAYAASLLPESKYDWYSFDVLSTSTSLHLFTQTPGSSGQQSNNALNPRIDLFDPNGNLVASGVPLPDGKNEVINYLPLQTGSYRVRVSTESIFAGEYILNTPPVIQGDLNQDGQRTSADVGAMLSALTDLSGYQAKNGLLLADLLTIADINGDGAVNNRDIQSLLNLIAQDEQAGSGSVAVEPRGVVVSPAVALPASQASSTPAVHSATVVGPLRVSSSTNVSSLAELVASSIDSKPASKVAKPAVSTLGKLLNPTSGTVSQNSVATIVSRSDALAERRAVDLIGPKLKPVDDFFAGLATTSRRLL